MTNEEAIKMLKSKMDGHTDTSYEWAETVRMAIKALEQEPCEDCVSRDIVHEMLENIPINPNDKWFNWLQKACLRLAELPSVQPNAEQKPKTGHWVTHIKSDKRNDYWPTNPKCSKCGGEPYYNNTIYNYKFCPYCGEKMESEE